MMPSTYSFADMVVRARGGNIRIDDPQAKIHFGHAVHNPMVGAQLHLEASLKSTLADAHERTDR
jgi:hypothetical protein